MELLEFPISRHCQRPMCPAWNIKGMYNSSCPCDDDHKEYTVKEYTLIVEWCQANYPS